MKIPMFVLARLFEDVAGTETSTKTQAKLNPHHHVGENSGAIRQH